jgi:radical SAM protein with 4Fe4S-binding SPASM domain
MYGGTGRFVKRHLNGYFHFSGEGSRFTLELPPGYNIMMKFYLSAQSHLKLLETPSVYVPATDELYELDEDAFAFLAGCSSQHGCESEQGEFTSFCLDEGILTTVPADVRRAPAMQAPTPSLRYLELQVTRRCNLKCRHCYIGPPSQDELSAEQIEAVLSEFERMQGLRVLITGGEPLMHRDFWSINEMLPDFAFRSVLFTNGTMVNREVLEKLKVHELQVSLDGLEEAHDALRGAGSYQKAVECLRTALDLGMAASVSTMVHSRNLADFDVMERMFRDIGVRNWTVDVPCIEGNLKDNVSFSLPPEQAGKYLGYGFGDGLHGGGQGYACGLHLMSVMADGSCAKCAFFAQNPTGHISDGLAACWCRVRPIRLEELACDCRFIDACRGGCRYRAELLGDPLGKDLYRCGSYDIINNRVQNDDKEVAQ